MAKRNTKHDYSRFENPFLYEQKSGETLEHYYKRLAKQADQRLVRLEQLSEKKGFEAVKQYSYARAIRDIRQWAGQDATRFNQKTPKARRQLEAKIRDMRTFLEAPTSTKAGIIKVYQKRADTINEKYGTDFSWQDLGNYFEQAKASKADKKYGSATELKAMGEIQKQSDTIVKQVKQHKKKHINVDNPLLQEVVDSMLSDRKLSLSMFY